MASQSTSRKNSYRHPGAGKSRFFERNAEAAAFCRNKYLVERLSVAMVHRALLRESARLLKGEKAPDYKTLRVFLQREVSPLVRMIARDGDKRYKEDAAPFIIRDISKIRVNQYWISDHMLHDVWVRNDADADGRLVFPELAENEALRPWLTCIVDMRSRRVVGPIWCATPSSRSFRKQKAGEITVRPAGDARRKHKPLRIDRLPQTVKEVIIAARAAGETWNRIAEMASAAAGMRLPRTSVQRWYDLRIELRGML